MCSYKQLSHSSQFRPPQTYRSARLSPPPKRSPQQTRKENPCSTFCTSLFSLLYIRELHHFWHCNSCHTRLPLRRKAISVKRRGTGIRVELGRTKVSEKRSSCCFVCPVILFFFLFQISPTDFPFSCPILSSLLSVHKTGLRALWNMSASDAEFVLDLHVHVPGASALSRYRRRCPVYLTSSIHPLRTHRGVKPRFHRILQKNAISKDEI